MLLRTGSPVSRRSAHHLLCGAANVNLGDPEVNRVIKMHLSVLHQEDRVGAEPCVDLANSAKMNPRKTHATGLEPCNADG